MIYERSITILEPFLVEQLCVEYMDTGALKSLKCLKIIQKRFNCQLITKYAKVEVLENYWDKFFGMLLNLAIKNKDADMKLLCSRIARIPKII